MNGPARPLAAPRVESKLNVPNAVSSAGQPTQPARTTQIAPLDVQMAGPSRPLAAPVAESRLKVPEMLAAPVAQPAASASVAPRLDVPTMNSPSRPLAAPVAESKLKVPEAATSTVGRPTTVAGPVETSALNAPPILVLSPTPGRGSQPVAVPPGEARGEFAISPQPNLTFPGTEPGVRGGSSTTTSNSGIVTLNSTTDGSNSRPANNTTTTSGTGRDAFPGITILGGGETNSSVTSRNSNSSATGPDKTPALPLQTSYDITILASGGSGGGLPDVGVFSNEQVHTVYLDMRETILDERVSWTVAFGVKQPEATSANERVTNVGGQQETVLPFPIEKTRPAISADLVRRYSGRLVLAYAIVNSEGKMEQLSIKQSPDPALNEPVLSALRKWSFRPARRNGEIIPAKILLGVIVQTY
jgi:TonB family protein